MRNLLIVVALLASTMVFSVHDQPSALASSCDPRLNASGNGDVDYNQHPISFYAGTTISVTMTTVSGGGTAIAVARGDFTDFVFESVIFSTPHTLTYTFTEDVLDGYLYIDWEYNGEIENTFTISCTGTGTPQIAPQVGMISISTAQAQPVYESAGGGVARFSDGNEIWLPSDYDGSGSDTHLIMSSTEIDGQLWYELFIGDGAAHVWVPADNVTVIE